MQMEMPIQVLTHNLITTTLLTLLMMKKMTSEFIHLDLC